MNYYYDIVANFFNDNRLFYEWEAKNLIYFKKIPVIRINSTKFNIVWNNKISINKELFNSIQDLALVYQDNEVKKGFNSILITDTRNALIIMFKNGIEEKRSTLLLKDDLDIIEYALNIKEQSIDIKIVDKIPYYDLLISEINIIKFIKSKIDWIQKNNEIDKIKYLYYEVENSKEENIEKIFKRISDYIKDENIKKLLKINKLLNLMYK